MTGAPSSLTLSDRVALVTGGSRGIGAGIAIELARKGARVAITYVSESSKAKAEEVVKQITDIHQQYGLSYSTPSAVAIQADAESLESPKKIVSETVKALGNTIHILVNNAGVAGDQPVGEITTEKYDKIMNVNVRGVIFLTQEVLPHFPKNGGGKIVNIGSVSAITGYNGQTVYGASKAAIEGLTRVWATELGKSHGITVNAVNPGPVDTDMFNGVSPDAAQNILNSTPAKLGNRMASVKEISDIVTFLCEDRSSWVTGDIVSSNGGAVYR